MEAKIHQIRFRLGLCLDPAGRDYIQRSPDLLTGFQGKGKGRGGVYESEGEGRRRKEGKDAYF